LRYGRSAPPARAAEPINRRERVILACDRPTQRQGASRRKRLNGLPLGSTDRSWPLTCSTAATASAWIRWWTIRRPRKPVPPKTVISPRWPAACVYDHLPPWPPPTCHRHDLGILHKGGAGAASAAGCGGQTQGGRHHRKPVKWSALSGQSVLLSAGIFSLSGNLHAGSVRTEFAADSSLEGDGFELSVPRERRHPSATANRLSRHHFREISACASHQRLRALRGDPPSSRATRA
jgi:hypothetical protein